MKDEILSVGIDIGTSTTSMVVSKLSVQNTASCFTVPHVDITDKEIVYRSPIYQTPQESGNRIDITRVAEIIEGEYKNAEIVPEDVQTGAVIITGESSRKENAQLVTDRMSQLAGEFVVASAGPDLESVIAGKGAGAQSYSEEKVCTVANFDVGGGTTNIASFRNGELESRGCYDIGGRLIRFENGAITYISERLEHLLRETGIRIQMGEQFRYDKIKRLTDRMADILGEAVGLLDETTACQLSKTIESSQMKKPENIQALSFSGGVADAIYHPHEDWLRYNDIGPLLADSIRKSNWIKKADLIPARETIQATVIGAGSYTTTVSGSTIAFSDESVFPMKNIPAYVVSEQQEKELLDGKADHYQKNAEWYLRENSADNIVFVLSHIKRPSYQQILNIADSLIRVSDILPKTAPLLIVCGDDFGKALGMAIQRKSHLQKSLVCLDSIHAESGDYIDFGRPLMGGMVIPVVVKTLIFG